MALLALAGCGGGKASEAPSTAGTTGARTTPSTPPGSTPAPATPSPLLPRGVPDHASGQAADRGDLAVVKRWLAALTRGDIEAAAATFADGAVVVNVSPPLRLRNRRDRIGFNRTFPCGAEVVDASTVKGYLVVTYRLTDRAGSACDGPGGTALGAIKVTRGRMTEWYRLPDPPQAPDAKAGPVV